jgi:hypothetical protein
VFDADQTYGFGTPQALEANYAKYEGRDIHVNYISQINEGLQKICVVCQSSKKGSDFEHIFVSGDVMRVGVSNEKTSVDLRAISVRPCFEGHSALMMVIYQLFKIASPSRMVFVRDCLPKTVAVLEHILNKFGILKVDYDNGEKYPDCYFSTMNVRLTAADFGIANAIIESDSSPLIQLNPHAFPTAAQLNDEEYVEEYFNSKHRRKNALV